MPTITKLCNKVVQTEGGAYQTFNDLNNLKLFSGADYAQTEIIKAKNQTPNQPSLLLLTQFRFNLPSGAKVTNIAVRYIHTLIKAGNEVCNIGRPTIRIAGPNDFLFSKEGQSPAIPGGDFTLNFPCNLEASVVNHNYFGVQFRYPANTNYQKGYLRLRHVSITLTYIIPEYELNLSKTQGNYNNEEYEIVAKISNTTDTKNTPIVSITLPIGFNLTDYKSNYNVTQVSSRVLSWTPTLNGVSSDTLTLHVVPSITYSGTSTSYTGTFEMSENYGSKYKSLNVTVLKTNPVTVEEIEPDNTLDIDTPDTVDVEPMKVHVGDVIDVNFDYSNFTVSEHARYYGFQFKVYTSDDVDVSSNFTPIFSYDEGEFYEDNISTFLATPDILYVGLQCDDYVADSRIEVYWHEYIYIEGEGGHYNDVLVYTKSDFEVVPPSIPAYTILTLTPEELNRLGDGYTYTLQSYLKVVTSESKVRKWDYNHRIGVFNNPILSNITTVEYFDENGDTIDITADTTDYNNLTPTEIIENAVFSPPPNNVNAYTNLTVDFAYNEEYPLYIIIMGDYTEMDTMANVKFTEPEIIESTTFKGAESNGIYPSPILNTLDNSESAEVVLPGYRNGSDIIFYDIPLNDEFTTEKYVIMGLEVNGNIENTDELVLSSKLVNGGNETRTKTKVIQPDDSTFTLGEYGDNWGFSTKQITNFKDWEIHLTTGNTLSTSQGSLRYNNLTFTLYVEKIEEEMIKTYIEGEDVAYYSAFLTDLSIPEGLNTDTDYLNVKGTDINKPYRQSIQEKTIELEFDIGGGCDLTGNTTILRNFTKLLVNKRDKYNSPILKRLEFSHYPDVYWEYLLEEVIPSEVDIGTYHVKAKLTIPSGTAYDKTPTVTSSQGFVNGIAHVNPILIIRPTNNLMSITDLDSNQAFNMGFSDFEGKFIEIDCANRKVYLKPDADSIIRTDISKYVDINSDWFRLLGSYNFRTVGCELQTIQYNERW